MAETVSGNSAPAPSGGMSVLPAADFIQEYYDTPVYDDTAVCGLLESILGEAARGNELLLHMSEGLDLLNDSIAPAAGAAEPLDAGPAGPEEPDPAEGWRETVAEALGNIENALSALEETSEGISSTVSGNALHLGDISSSGSALNEAFTEAAGQHSYLSTYSVSTSIGLLFVSACIAGLLIAGAVWGRMR